MRRGATGSALFLERTEWNSSSSPALLSSSSPHSGDAWGAAAETRDRERRDTAGEAEGVRERGFLVPGVEAGAAAGGTQTVAKGLRLGIFNCQCLLRKLHLKNASERFCLKNAP